ncbi:metal ABC transporter solute-binding protein, Zn/Mn family [Roseovarius sp.]|uniref:metal ABC transporter solute-binding protein, Zn/Mn family n=1 Tax=Roseovarius sp. TaxID=1486281 RepID=UPI003517A82B
MTGTGKHWVGAMTLVAGLGLPVAAMAEPAVVTDIAPVESLVARVMQGVGTPGRLVPRGASPHDARLKPSDAAALAKADLVVMVGGGLTPWLSEAQQSLAPEAHVIRLMEAETSIVLPTRDEVEFAHEDHGHEEHGHDEHGHDEHGHGEHGHDDHGHDEKGHGEKDHDDHAHDDKGHDDHGHDEAGHDGHDHGPNDPHGWLDPENARAWARLIADELIEQDPDNAAVYRENLAQADAEIVAAQDKARALLEPVKDVPFVVSHDAFQYFEKAFDVTAAGAIALSDARAPGPKRVAEIREVLEKRGVACVLTEPGLNPALAQSVAEVTGARLVALDPMGLELAEGPGLYPAMIVEMATRLAGCLSES